MCFLQLFYMFIASEMIINIQKTNNFESNLKIYRFFSKLSLIFFDLNTSNIQKFSILNPQPTTHNPQRSTSSDQPDFTLSNCYKAKIPTRNFLMPKISIGNFLTLNTLKSLQVISLCQKSLL